MTPNERYVVCNLLPPHPGLTTPPYTCSCALYRRIQPSYLTLPLRNPRLIYFPFTPGFTSPPVQISVIIEFVAGKVTDNIDRLIALYRPESVVVGTRGQRGVIQTWGAALGAPGMGSVSKYCLSRSPVPIIVVRPEKKVRKAQAKRKADPKRGQHFGE